MKIVVAGASGFVGAALVPALRAQGHDVRRLVRRAAVANDEIGWDPANGVIDLQRGEEVDAVINLAGENVAAGRWTAARREQILRSRVDATRTLVGALLKLVRKPKVFLSASAVGYYGDRGDEIVTEKSPIGVGLLPEVCLAWETHAEGAARHGIRTVLLRFGTILSPEGGALAKMLPLFRLGLGGRLGSGQQWMSWIARDDVVQGIFHVLRDTDCGGPVNFAAPAPVTNVDFAATLARVLGRPARLPAPGFALRLAFGQMADEALLASTRAVPRRLVEVNYTFRQPELEPALRAMLSGTVARH